MVLLFIAMGAVGLMVIFGPLLGTELPTPLIAGVVVGIAVVLDGGANDCLGADIDGFCLGDCDGVGTVELVPRGGEVRLDDGACPPILMQ